jgi:hypothetical protein
MSHIIGFVFSCPPGLYNAIISFHIRPYANLPAGKLALFFQITFQILPFAFLPLPFPKIGFELALFFQIRSQPLNH